MSDYPPPGGPGGEQPPPYQPPPQQPAPGQPPPGQQPWAPQQYTSGPGPVPQSLDEIWYKPGLNILLYVITCGIWGVAWSYRTHDDLQKHNGDGLGGGIAAILALLVGVVIMFTVPMELEKAYQRRGWQSPENAMLGLWFLLPVVGQFIWYLKIQRALNAYWQAMGSRPAA